MQHFLVCKYDYDDLSYVDEWTTLCELLRSTDLYSPSIQYLTLEKEFLYVVVQFFKAYADRSFQFRFCYLIHDVKEIDANAGHLQNLLLPLNDGIALIDKKLNELSLVERLALFQLAVRGEVVIVVESIDKPSIVLSTVDDGFYWFLSLTNDCDPESLVQSNQLYIYESIDIFDPA